MAPAQWPDRGSVRLDKPAIRTQTDAHRSMLLGRTPALVRCGPDFTRGDWSDVTQNSDGTRTDIDFNHIGAIVEHVVHIQSLLRCDVLDMGLDEGRWTPLERPRGRGDSPFGTFDEGNEVLRTAVASRATMRQGVSGLIGELEYTAKTLTKMMADFHSVEELNRAEAQGGAGKLPMFGVLSGQPRTGS